MAVGVAVVVRLASAASVLVASTEVVRMAVEVPVASGSVVRMPRVVTVLVTVLVRHQVVMVVRVSNHMGMSMRMAALRLVSG